MIKILRANDPVELENLIERYLESENAVIDKIHYSTTIDGMGGFVEYSVLLECHKMTLTEQGY